MHISILYMDSTTPKVYYQISIQDPHCDMILKNLKPIECRSVNINNNKLGQWIAISRSKKRISVYNMHCVLKQYSKDIKVGNYLKQYGIYRYIKELRNTNRNMKVVGFVRFKKIIKLSSQNIPNTWKPWILEVDGNIKYKYAYIIDKVIDTSKDLTCILKGQLGVCQIHNDHKNKVQLFFDKHYNLCM